MHRELIEKVTILQAMSNHSSGHMLITKANPTPELTTYGIKLGWIQGVLIPCLLNIWGVMLFLRIAWIVAQAGMGLTIVIISIASMVCVITTLSLSAICTNGVVQGGGVYYLVSRSLGAELGASVGIIFAFANAVAASMNTIGFCESLNELLKSHGFKILGNGIDDTRIVGAIALFVMCFICAIGMDWESRAQNFLIIIIVFAIINYIIGAFMGPSSDSEKAHGFSGINKYTFQQNWLPDFRYSESQNHNLISVFAIYFPAVTGVQAGANICGDLKNPATAIPKGTLTALVISVSSYVVMATLAGASAERDASGNVSDFFNGTLAACKPDCAYGLHNSYEIMHLIALWSPLIYGGCWAATLSTALTNLLSVPRLIQALGVDRIYPGLIFFSKPYGRHGEPYRGYVLTFCISLLFLLIADLNTIAPLITNFYLASYALINFCTFHAGFTKAISWRPTFRYYNTWLSLFGFIICIVIMILMSWLMALITVLVFFTLYLLVVYRKPDARWGSSTDAYKYREAVSALLAMSARAGHVKEYSPRPLVLCGAPAARRALLDLAAMLTADGSFMIAANITDDTLSNDDSLKQRHKMVEWLHSHRYRAFYLCIEGMNLENGARTLMQCAGLGRFSPNIVLLGYKTDWCESPGQDLVSYVEIIRLAFERQFAVCIFRMPRHLREWPAAASAQAESRDAAEARAVFAVMHSSSDFQLDEAGRIIQSFEIIAH
ncbi:unnamed protein product [Chilo suppressalis]|uniref:Amino acid permease/ SLC12A domain-containing protein n=1 Tax=Chilo suppressalis TaxID=168631 RepID=A0ABN8ATX1_CHISP|nr:unnamed protein product [Chilo suppressalis]